MSRLFGTDGVRGLANGPLITAEMALAVSVAAARVLGQAGADPGHRPKAVVGRDPRASGEFLGAAVVAGLAAAGVDVYNAGVLPTPAIAYLTSDAGADFGVMLSASHNAMPDNGIKFFARGGHKLPDEVEDRIEAAMDEDWQRPTGADVGRVVVMSDGHTRYLSHLLRVLPNRLDGLKVVIDGAHGAASQVSPEVFRLAGAEVFEIGTSPDGLNINDGYGSTHLDPLKTAVRAHGADLGIAHDGDADRCLAVDSTGTEVDGDQIMGILAVALKERGVLAPRHPRRHRHEQPRPAAGDGARGHPRAADRGRRPLRARGDARRRLLPRRRAVRARHPARPRHHRRRHAHRPDAGGPDGRRPAARWPTSAP